MKKKTVLIIAIVCVVLIIVTAVFGSAKNADKSSEESRSAYAAAESSAAAYGTYYEEEVATEEADAKEAPASVAVNEEAIQQGEKLVYSADISLESRSYIEHRNFIYGLTEKYDVIIEDMSENAYDSVRYGSFTLRVPYQNFTEVYRLLSDEQNGWKLIAASSRVENMTKQYAKIASQIEAFETEKATLTELLKEATSVSETLEIQDRLAWLNSDLQYYYDQRENIDSSVSMSTIRVSLQEIKVPEIQKSDYTFGERAAVSFRSGLARFAAFWQNLALAVINGWTFILLFAAVVFCAILCRKHIRRKKISRKEETQPDMEDAQDEP